MLQRTSLATDCLATICYWLALCIAIGVFTPVAFAELPERIVLRHLATFPHDDQAFTQGLLWHDGYLYESTGKYGRSSIRRVEPTTGRIVQRFNMPSQFFGEGLTLFGDSLFQLTWRENVAFVYDRETFEITGRFQYLGEGWGLTNNDNQLIMSNGSNVLQFRDPRNFRLVRSINVFDRRGPRPQPVYGLNELQWIRGEVWAKVFMTTRIVRINPRTGNVIGWIDMAPFVPPEHRVEGTEAVLNGIAFDPENNHVYITGKLWNVMHKFLIEIPGN